MKQPRGGGVTQTFFIRGCAILALNIAPINPAALPKKDSHKTRKTIASYLVRHDNCAEHEQGRKNYFEAILFKSIPINPERA